MRPMKMIAQWRRNCTQVNGLWQASGAGWDTKGCRLVARGVQVGRFCILNVVSVLFLACVLFRRVAHHSSHVLCFRSFVRLMFSRAI